MPDTRLIKPNPVATKPKHLNKKASRAETTPAVRTRDVGHRKNRASSCPRCTSETEYKHKTMERSNKAIQAKPSETSPRSKHMHRRNDQCQKHIRVRFLKSTEAEAEFAALEDLRLSRAKGYISISPSIVDYLLLSQVGAYIWWRLGQTTTRNANQEKTKAG